MVCLWYNKEEIIVSANLVTEEFMVKTKNVKHIVIRTMILSIRHLDNSVSGTS